MRGVWSEHFSTGEYYFNRFLFMNGFPFSFFQQKKGITMLILGEKEGNNSFVNVLYLINVFTM